MAVENDRQAPAWSGDDLIAGGPVAAGLKSAGADIDWLQALGLLRDPFDAADAAFFPGAGRQQLLDQLLHQCQFSASALVVLGEAGAGKSALRRELLSHLAADDDICTIDVPAIYDADRLLAQIVAGFGLEAADSASRGQLLAQIRHFCQSGEEGSLALLLVENAHHLDDQLLSALLSLLQGQEDSIRPLHLVLFGDPTLALRLDNFGIVDVLVHDLLLEPLDREEVGEYLDFCLQQAGYSGEALFTERDLDTLWRQSQGLPGRLNPLARRLLIEAAAPASEGRPRLPLAHVVAVTVLAGVLIMALFYGGDSDESSADTAAVATAPAPAAAVAAADAAARQLPPDPPPAPSGPVAGTAPPALENLPSPAAGDGRPTEVAAAAAEREVAAAVQATPAAPPAAFESAPARPPPPAAAPPPAWSADEAALMASEESAYTLQLLAAASEDSVRQFIRRQAGAVPLRMFTTRRAGKNWYVVVHGNFPSAASARSAIGGLPAALREAGPWPRSMLSVQTEIASFHRN